MGERSEEWDKKNPKHKGKWGDPRILLILIAVMVVMWFAYGTLTVVLQPVDCQEIINFIDSPQYLELTDIEKRNANKVLQDNCEQRIVK